MNAGVNVVTFFGDHIYQDLEAVAGEELGNELLRVDAIRFLNTFRSQVSYSSLRYFFQNLTFLIVDKTTTSLRSALTCSTSSRFTELCNVYICFNHC